MRKRPNASPKGQTFDWDDFFQRLSVTPPNALTREGLESVFVFWVALPYFLGTRGAVAVQDGLACFRMLRETAEAGGLDSAPLDRSASIFMRLAGGPFSRRFACKPDRPSSWPPLSQSVNAFAGRPKPSAEDRRICQAAEDVVSRLMAQPASTKALTPVELLALVREQRKRADGLYAEHAHLPPRVRQVICGVPPTLACDVAYRAALEAAAADPAVYHNSLPPERTTDALADLGNLERWVLAIMRQKIPGRGKRRRHKTSRAWRPLTQKQTEAMHIIGECKGNIAEAARTLGVAANSLRERYNTACEKLGKEATRKPKPRTVRLPLDRRGQSALAAPTEGSEGS